MKELTQEIQELKSRISQLEGMIWEQEQITKDYGRFVPEDFETFYSIDNDNSVYDLCIMDQAIIDMHNAFPTRISAEYEAYYTLISRQYRNFARKLNNGKPFDWDDENQDKFGVVFGWNDYGDAEKAVLYVDRWTTTNALILQLAFHEKAHAELALKVFGNDLLILCS